MTDAEVIVIGSGPAGVSAAWPMVEAGIRVLMVDAAESDCPPPPPHQSLAEWRQDPVRWQTELGRAGVLASLDKSPKFATALSQAVLDGFSGALGLEVKDYAAVGSLAAGGLSRIWGALVPRYSAADLAQFPGSAEEMQAAYTRTTRRIGISGEEEESAAPLSSAIARLCRDPRISKGRAGFSLGPAPNAVLSKSKNGRLACNACGLCLYGCGRQSIYHSALELPALNRFSNFRYRPGVRVTHIGETSGLQTVQAVASGTTISLCAPTLVLAAGTLMTTSLALRRLRLTGHPVRLRNNPVGGAAFVVPALIGRDLPDRSFSLAQLFYTLDVAGDEVAGGFYGADALPLATLADRLPFTRPFALRVARALSPALILATGYLPGAFSDNVIVVEEDGEVGRLRIETRPVPEADRLLRRAFGQLGREVRRRGGLPVPGSITLLPPGADAHPTSTLPMGGDGPAATDSEGGLIGAPGVFVVDGAALPILSARHPTLTIMANADRIGHALARRLVAVPKPACAG